MISVEEAQTLILEQKLPLQTERVPLLAALNRVLAEDLLADRPFPAFDRVTMDGVALYISENVNPYFNIEIEHVHFAGDPLYTLKNPNAGIEVMTGAILPAGTNTVIPYEDLEKTSDRFFTTKKPAFKDKNIHKCGSDASENEVLIKAPHKINSTVLAVAASISKTHLLVVKPPKIAVISTGNELVDVSENVLPHQIRRSNNYAIHGILAEYATEIQHFHISDHHLELTQTLATLLDSYQVLILSGGVSMGQKDLVPAVLTELGVRNIFHKIAQKPGKPLWFGKTDQTLVFGCPGNPSSTTLCTLRYIKPWLIHNLGLSFQPLMVVLNGDLNIDGTLTRFLQVKSNVNHSVSPIPNNGSGDFLNLTNATGYIELKPGFYKKGEMVKLHKL